MARARYLLPATAIFACLSLQVEAGSAGLGAVLTTKDGGQIFGFDIDQTGEDGVLASAKDASGGGFQVSVEVFDQDSGKIVKSIAKETGEKNSYAVDGVAAGDVALITHFITPKGTIFAKRKYQTMSPVGLHKLNGEWTPPLKNIDVQQLTTDQASSQSIAFVIELKKNDKPALIVSDVAANTFTNVIHLDPARYGLGNGPHVAQYTAGQQAVLATSPDGGAVGGFAPLIATVDLSNGQIHEFSGYNNGEFHAGYVNGLAVDPNTGVAATTSELNAQVEFYDMVNRRGIIAVQLPCTGDTDQLDSGSNIAVDPVNKLFLVTETNYGCGGQSSAIVVYDEAGNFVEAITGFKFAVGEPAPAINPSKRMGWAFGGPAGFSQLQQFFY